MSVRTNKKAALKLMNQIASYCFEQECGELYRKDDVMKKLREAQHALESIL